MRMFVTKNKINTIQIYSRKTDLIYLGLFAKSLSA